MIIPVPAAAQHGLITDQPHNELPLNAWTDALNVRFRDGAVERLLGYEEVFAGTLIAPHWLFHSSQGGSALWLYAGLTAVGATDGTVHEDITRLVGGAYSMSLAAGWTGGVVEDIPVINNGVDVPQMWNKPQMGTKLANLTNWPTGVTVNSLRGFKRYLMGFDVTKAGVRYPTMIKWSHQAPTGSVPASWNETDETVDAGEYVLPAEGGYLVDGIPLRDVMILYKENETWIMQYVGGIDVFRFRRVFTSIGALTRRCAKEFFGGKQLVFTGDDVVLHDGQTAKSILSERIRSVIDGKIDSSNYNKCFVAVNYPQREVMICFPETGQSVCTKALLWNWLRDSWGVRELPGTTFIESGMVNPAQVGETWEGAVGDWSTDNTSWGDRASDPTKQKLVMTVPGLTKLYSPDQTLQIAGTDMIAYVERRGLGFPLKTNQPPDYTRMKQINAIWPRITGTAGGVINIYLGTQERLESPVVWGPAESFRIGESTFADFANREASRIHALKFESNSAIMWKLHGYDADVVDRGQH